MVFLLLTETLKEFNEYILKNEATQKKIEDLKTRVEDYASKYPLPGFEM